MYALGFCFGASFVWKSCRAVLVYCCERSDVSAFIRVIAAAGKFSPCAFSKTLLAVFLVQVFPFPFLAVAKCIN